ncbi:MAG: DNA repair protein RadC [Anaerolineae bacterium]|jgi:DNA repair protein RadC|nr:DNA repair protein RadC [Anaerolineae bacterium]
MDNQRAYKITELSTDERPRERLAELGPEALLDEELLAILLRTGIQGENAVEMGQRLLVMFGGIQGIHQAAFEDFCSAKGIGPAKAAQIKAAIELGRRLHQGSVDNRPVINSPQDVANLVQYEMMAYSQEHLWVLLLNTRNQVVRIDKVYKGTLNSSTVRVAELFRSAIRQSAASIIMVHNHPSGDPAPSPEDIRLTRSVIEAGHLLDIEVLDHIVVGFSGKFISMKQRKMGFTV